MRRLVIGLLVGLLLVQASGVASAQSPSPSPALAVQRIEVPEARIALELPDDWVVDVEMHEFTPIDMGGGMGELIGLSVLQAHSPTEPARCGLFTHELAPFVQYFVPLPDYVDLLVDTWVETFIGPETDYYSSNELDLPAGDAIKVAYGGATEAGPPLDVLHYFLQEGGSLRHVLLCHGTRCHSDGRLALHR